MKIAIIGSGNLGLSIAKGLIYNNTYTSLYLTKRDLSEIKKWEESGVPTGRLESGWHALLPYRWPEWHPKAAETPCAGAC